MNDHPKKPQSLSEISHLFLSGIREKQTQGMPRPVRVPPSARQVADAASAPAKSEDLTPEEYAEMSGHSIAAESDAAIRVPAVSAVISQHLNGSAAERVREYARHLAANGERIGVIELDLSECRLMCYERSTQPNATDPAPPEIVEHFDPRQMTQALEELTCDLDHWLLVLPNLRSPEARTLLKEVENWTLLSTTDHDGVVSCYRTLKGLASIGQPRLSLALMETASPTQAAKIFRKLNGVCIQFLGIELQSEPAVRPTRAVAEHLVAHFRANHDKSQLAGSAAWTVVTEFLARVKAQAAEAALRAEEEAVDQAGSEEESANGEGSSPEQPAFADDYIAMGAMPTSAAPASPAIPPAISASASAPTISGSAVTVSMPTNASATVAPAASPMAGASADSQTVMPFSSVRMAGFNDSIDRDSIERDVTTEARFTLPAPANDSPASDISEVIDLPGELQGTGPIVSAILAHAAGQMLECPIRPPMCPEARLAVTRERGLVLLAVARKGLADLKLIAQAYRWLNENRALIGMAIPQMAIDAHRAPRLRLLIDHADAAADALAPMLENGLVSVQAYRKLRWGQRTGLLLEAA